MVDVFLALLKGPTKISGTRATPKWICGLLILKEVINFVGPEQSSVTDNVTKWEEVIWYRVMPFLCCLFRGNWDLILLFMYFFSYIPLTSLLDWPCSVGTISCSMPTREDCIRLLCWNTRNQVINCCPCVACPTNIWFVKSEFWLGLMMIIKWVQGSPPPNYKFVYKPMIYSDFIPINATINQVLSQFGCHNSAVKIPWNPSFCWSKSTTYFPHASTLTLMPLMPRLGSWGSLRGFSRRRGVYGKIMINQWI